MFKYNDPLQEYPMKVKESACLKSGFRQHWNYKVKYAGDFAILFTPFGGDIVDVLLNYISIPGSFDNIETTLFDHILSWHHQKFNGDLLIHLENSKKLLGKISSILRNRNCAPDIVKSEELFKWDGL